MADHPLPEEDRIEIRWRDFRAVANGRYTVSIIIVGLIVVGFATKALGWW